MISNQQLHINITIYNYIVLTSLINCSDFTLYMLQMNGVLKANLLFLYKCYCGDFFIIHLRNCVYIYTCRFLWILQCFFILNEFCPYYLLPAHWMWQLCGLYALWSEVNSIHFCEISQLYNFSRCEQKLNVGRRKTQKWLLKTFFSFSNSSKLHHDHKVGCSSVLFWIPGGFFYAWFG